MKFPLLVTALVSILSLSACTSVTSFSPPVVKATGYSEDLTGAIALVDKFVMAYRGHAKSTSNGRQYFDVPTFTTAIGAVVATAFGAGPNATFYAGSVGALSGAGKAYYDPDAKATIYTDALDAFLCIQQVALDIEPFQKNDAAVKALGLEKDLDDFRLFTVIKNAALSVETIARTRLRKVGSAPDIDTLTAKLKEAIEAQKNKEDEAASTGSQKNFTDENKANLEKVLTLVPKLQTCVLRAGA